MIVNDELDLLLHPEEEETKQKHSKRKACIIVAVISVLLLGIAVTLLFLVGFPLIAQHAVNSSTLSFSSISITNPGNTSFMFYAKGRVLYNCKTDCTHI